MSLTNLLFHFDSSQMLEDEDSEDDKMFETKATSSPAASSASSSKIATPVIPKEVGSVVANVVTTSKKTDETKALSSPAASSASSSKIATPVIPKEGGPILAKLAPSSHASSSKSKISIKSSSNNKMPLPEMTTESLQGKLLIFCYSLEDGVVPFFGTIENVRVKNEGEGVFILKVNWAAFKSFHPKNKACVEVNTPASVEDVEVELHKWWLGFSVWGSWAVGTKDEHQELLKMYKVRILIALCA